MAAFSRARLLPFARLAALITLTASLPLVSATFSIARCCTVAVRGEFLNYWNGTHFYPWEVCNLNKEIDYGTTETFPSVTRSMSWAKQFCHGTQYSTLRQWLQPLVAYISPYIGLLLLCPVGGGYPDECTQLGPLRSFFHSLKTKTKDYISILGDPASAVFGAASEVYADTVGLYSISSLSVDRQLATWVAALAGALEFSARTDWCRDVQGDGDLAQPTPEPESPLQEDEITAAADKSTAKIRAAAGDDGQVTAADEARRAVAFCIVARTPFTSAVLIPVVLTLAVTAAAFYDAYAKKGDKDTGLALAYCLWYSWILVPAVAGNSFATALSPEVARRAFGRVMRFRGGVVVVPLAERHVNNRFWANWVRRQEGGGRDYVSFVEQLAGDGRFWFLFCAGKLAAWCCVAVACGGAARIAWTTPTVGLGCRSFNFILYGLLAFVNGLLHVLCSWLSVRGRLEGKTDGPRQRIRGLGDIAGMLAKLTFADGVRAAYWFLVLVNSAVMVLGTLFHLVGVFRTCRCDRLLWDGDAMIELNSKTELAVVNANKYWLSTSYFVFSIMTLVCFVAVVFRQMITRRMDEWLEENE